MLISSEFLNIPTGVRACPRSGKSKLLEDLNALTGCGRTSVSKLFLYSRESLLLFCFFSFLDFFSFIFLCFLCLFRLSFFLLCVWHLHTVEFMISHYQGKRNLTLSLYWHAIGYSIYLISQFWFMTNSSKQTSSSTHSASESDEECSAELWRLLSSCLESRAHACFRFPICFRPTDGTNLLQIISLQHN